MKYTFKVIICLSYRDKETEVELELSDEEVERIKKLVSKHESKKKKPADPEDYVPETSLLQVLQEGAPDLFRKFWAVIYKPVFVELLINAMENYGADMMHDDDPTDDPEDYRDIPFEELYKMYGPDIEMEHSSCCICRIPEEFVKKT